jgi:ABC-type sugar transport system ATPase subunit
MAEITLRNAGMTYPNGTKALSGVDLTVKDHEFLVLLGPSGCGKSTLLRLVAGLEKPTEGDVLFDGKVANDVKPINRNVAMVFQNFALYPHLNVYKNMAFPLKSMKLKPEEIQRRVEEAARILDIEHVLNRRPRVLSGGQRQRVAVGRAIVREPAVFLFDEPLSNLDAKMRVEMRAEIVRLHHRLGATMIYVTHDQTEAMTMGDRIVVMEGGRIQQAAPPLEVYDHPANKFVASFIGTPPMNLLPPGVLDLGRTVGVRPEHLRICPVEGDGAPEGALLAHVDIVEPLGAETLVHAVLDARKTPVVARVPGSTVVRHGDVLALVPDMSKAVKFTS